MGYKNANLYIFLWMKSKYVLNRKKMIVWFLKIGLV